MGLCDLDCCFMTARTGGINICCLCMIRGVWWRSLALCMKQHWVHRGSTEALNNSTIFMLHKRCPPTQQLFKVNEAALSASSVGHQRTPLPDLLLFTAPSGAWLMLQACASCDDGFMLWQKSHILASLWSQDDVIILNYAYPACLMTIDFGVAGEH